MNLATCNARLVLAADKPRLPRVHRKAYGTAGYWQADAEQVSANGATRQLCWSMDHVNVWYENINDAGDMIVELLRGWIPVVRKLVTAEVEHFDTNVVWADLPEGSPVGLSLEGMAIYKLPFDL